MNSACFSCDGMLQMTLFSAADGENAIHMDRPLLFRGVYILCQCLIVAGHLPQPIGDFGLVA